MQAMRLRCEDWCGEDEGAHRHSVPALRGPAEKASDLPDQGLGRESLRRAFAVAHMTKAMMDVPQSATESEQCKASVERANTHSRLPADESNVSIVIIWSTLPSPSVLQARQAFCTHASFAFAAFCDM